MANNQKETISVREAGRRLGVGDEVLQAGLISGQLAFGQALKLPSGRYRYLISRVAFDRWMHNPYERIHEYFPKDGGRKEKK